MRVLIFSIILFYNALLNGQNGINLFNNAVSSALNNSNIAARSAKSLSLNPAAMTNVSKFYFSVGAQQSFLINEINQGNLDVAYKMKSGNAAGLQLYYFGNKTFNEIKGSFAYAVDLADNTSIALRLHGVMITSPENEKQYAGTFSLGGQTMLTPQFGVGLVTFNPIGFFRENKTTDLSHNIQLGIGYHPAEYLSLFLSATLDDGHPLSVAGGFAYNIRKKLYLYLSAQANPGVIGLGIGIPFGKGSSVDIAGSQHLQLGFSPAINYTYSGPEQ